MLRPTSTDAYCIFFSALLLVPVKIDRHLFFVTDFGIVCLGRLPFCRNGVTRSARAHEYVKGRTNRRQVNRTGNIVVGSVDLVAGLFRA